MITLLLSCATAAPPEASDGISQETLTVRVPIDCPHLIVDVTSQETSDITVACFDNVLGQTHLERFTSTTLGVACDEAGEDRLVVEFAAREDPPAIVRP
ncbi:hypothetical protein HY631_04220 [Candidatus Uhrbacteria bacterium]|nr:hypothetical protein [Candidatus Uhrbacteria bacterium]